LFQTLYLASTLIKFIWSSSGSGGVSGGGGSGATMGEWAGESVGDRSGEAVADTSMESATNMGGGQPSRNQPSDIAMKWAKLGIIVTSPRRAVGSPFSSCDNSGSMGSNSDEEQVSGGTNVE